MKNKIHLPLLLLVLGVVTMPRVFSMVEDFDAKKNTEENASEMAAERTVEARNIAAKAAAAGLTTFGSGAILDRDPESFIGEDRTVLPPPAPIDYSPTALDQKGTEAEDDIAIWRQEYERMATFSSIPPDEFERLHQDARNAATYWRQEQEMHATLVGTLDQKQGPQRRAINRVRDACEEAPEAGEQVQEKLTQLSILDAHESLNLRGVDLESGQAIESTPVRGRLAQGWSSNTVQEREAEYAKLKVKRDQYSKDSPEWQLFERERINAYQRLRYAQKLVGLDRSAPKKMLRRFREVIHDAGCDPQRVVRKIKTQAIGEHATNAEEDRDEGSKQDERADLLAKAEKSSNQATEMIENIRKDYRSPKLANEHEKAYQLSDVCEKVIAAKNAVVLAKKNIQDSSNQESAKLLLNMAIEAVEKTIQDAEFMRQQVISSEEATHSQSFEAHKMELSKQVAASEGQQCAEAAFAYAAATLEAVHDAFSYFTMGGEFSDQTDVNELSDACDTLRAAIVVLNTVSEKAAISSPDALLKEKEALAIENLEHAAAQVRNIAQRIGDPKRYEWEETTDTILENLQRLKSEYEEKKNQYEIAQSTRECVIS